MNGFLINHGYELNLILLVTSECLVHLFCLLFFRLIAGILNFLKLFYTHLEPEADLVKFHGLFRRVLFNCFSPNLFETDVSRISLSKILPGTLCLKRLIGLDWSRS